MKKENDILDVLFETENKENEEELPIPKKCSTCMTGMVCNALSSIIQLHKIHIFVEITKCPFHNPINIQK